MQNIATIRQSSESVECLAYICELFCLVCSADGRKDVRSYGDLTAGFVSATEIDRAR